MVSETQQAEDGEAWRQALLSKIVGDDELSGEDLERHEQFLKAKEDALAALATQQDAVAKTSSLSRRTQQVRFEGKAFDEETARKLELIAGRAAKDATRREMERSKQASQALTAAKQEAQTALQAAVAELPKDQKAASLAPTWISDEEYKELGYPQLDPKFRSNEWQKKQLQLDSTDPRHNPNLNRDQNDPEFWYHAARKPFNKALLRTEQHWNSRREVWLKQFEQVKDLNQKRELLAELLEDTSTEVKRLVAPILHFSITMKVLSGFVEKAKQLRKSFHEIVSSEESLTILQGIRDRVDEFGSQAADDMLTEYDARARTLATDRQEEKQDQEKKIADVHTLAQIMNWGQKCKKDGLVEWEQGNWMEAYVSWRQADDTLRPFKAADKENNQVYSELHTAVLKNLSQACMKLGLWHEAAKAAETATQLSPEDHKVASQAWFRWACALEGLGQLDEAEECLHKIDECSVGRPDRTRISKDTQAKREKLQALRDREQASLKKTLEKAIARNVFSEERQDQDQVLQDLAQQPAVSPSKAFIEEEANEVTRKHLTKEGAKDLLKELRDAYRDTTFQLQIFKLARDVRGEKQPFLTNLAALALPLQKPVLEAFGFAPNEKGLKEMIRALQDHLHGPGMDETVKRAADETTMALYGVMYDKLTRPDDSHEAPRLEARLGRDPREDEDSS
ncbi:unnamed protein product [Durusdinium trenchii]|uniref:peptidylprolyl isomerase n=1 Tax=Durusdinium trenchii TaxID=1381693 RepID=A0ABP0P444_9DINO